MTSKLGFGTQARVLIVGSLSTPVRIYNYESENKIQQQYMVYSHDSRYMVNRLIRAGWDIGWVI